MISRIARQYRRFFLGGILLTILILVGLATGAFDRPEDAAFNAAFVAAWVIVVMIVIGVPVALLSLCLPSLLALVELFLTALILMTVIDPPLRAVLGGTLPNWVSCTILVLIFLVLERSIYGPLLSGFWRRDMQRKTGHFMTAATPEAVWRSLFPDPDHEADFYWPEARFLAAAEGSSADFIMSLPRRSGCKNTLAEVIVEVAEPNRHFRYRTRPLAGSGDPAQIIGARIDPQENGRVRASYSEQNLDVPFGQRLFFYLNNGFRDTLASLRARLGGRKDRSIQGLQMLRR